VVPWFAIGFLACVVVNSLHVLPASVTQMLNLIDTFALTMAMTALDVDSSNLHKAGVWAEALLTRVDRRACG
jgi:uncharacterized membrane protein YadS